MTWLTVDLKNRPLFNVIELMFPPTPLPLHITSIAQIFGGCKISLVSVAVHLLTATNEYPISMRPSHPQKAQRTASIYLRGMKREEWVAPIPGLPCLTGSMIRGMGIGKTISSGRRICRCLCRSFEGWVG